MKSPVSSTIGFADAEVCGYEKTGDCFVVRVQTWEEKTLLITFTDVIGMIDRDVANIYGFVIENESNPFLVEMINLTYEQPPEKHSYKLFQFLNLDDYPALEIVAISVNFSWQ